MPAHAIRPARRVYPGLAGRECRTVFVLHDAPGEPPRDAYTPLEMYCDEIGCDCRRVLLAVHAKSRRAVVPRVNFGWEPRASYQDWRHGSATEADLDELAGPAPQRLAPQSDPAEHRLAAARIAPQDANSVARLARHDALVRARGYGRVGPYTACPCGSGTKRQRSLGLSGKVPEKARTS